MRHVSRKYTRKLPNSKRSPAEENKPGWDVRLPAPRHTCMAHVFENISAVLGVRRWCPSICQPSVKNFGGSLNWKCLKGGHCHWYRSCYPICVTDGILTSTSFRPALQAYDLQDTVSDLSAMKLSAAEKERRQAARKTKNAHAPRRGAGSLAGVTSCEHSSDLVPQH